MKLDFNLMVKYAFRGVALYIFGLLWTALTAMLGITAFTLGGAALTAVSAIWLVVTFVAYGFAATFIVTRLVK